MPFRQNPLLSRWFKLYAGTPAEHAIEPAVAALGLPYRFNHPLWSRKVFPDFCWPLHKAILEVDGAEHFTRAGLKKDAERTALLNADGWSVVRTTNAAALSDPSQALCVAIRSLPIHASCPLCRK